MKPYIVTFHDPGYIEMVYHGYINSADIAPLICDILSLAKEYNCYHFLGDFRNAELNPNISLGMIYHVPRQIFLAAEAAGIQIGMYKRAFIGTREYFDKFRFFEIVSLNRVQTVRVFLEKDEARNWLMDEYVPTPVCI